MMVLVLHLVSEPLQGSCKVGRGPGRSSSLLPTIRCTLPVRGAGGSREGEGIRPAHPGRELGGIGPLSPQWATTTHVLQLAPRVCQAHLC